MNNYELTHYGVLGMKWGVRRPKVAVDRAAESKASPSKTASDKNLRKSSSSKKSPTEFLAAVGESKILNLLAIAGGVRIYSNSIRAMMESGKPSAIDALQAIGGFAIASRSLASLSKG